MENTQNTPTPPPPPPPASTPPARKGGAGRIIGIILVSIGGLIGIAMALGGIGLVIAHGVLRDDDGFYTTDTERSASRGYAVTSDGIDLGRESIGFNSEDLGATLRFSAESVGGKPVFVGIGPQSDVDAYLRGVPHTQVDDFRDRGPVYTQVPGRSRPRGEPAAQDFWVAQSEGTGVRNADFDLESGTWTAVAMNADASRPVAVEGEAGVKIGWLIWVGVGVGLAGLVIAGSCAYAIIRMAGDGRSRQDAAPAA